MKKEYELPEENSENDNVNEAGTEYYKTTGILPSPSLTEEELQEIFTSEQAKEHIHKHIHKLFNQ